MYKNIYKLNKLIKSFGVKIALYSVGESLFSKFRINKYRQVCHKKKYELVKKYIRNNYADIISKYKGKNIGENIGEKYKIWFFWWQGMDEAPKVVKICYKQLIKVNAGKRKVIVLDSRNYSKYTNIPEYVIEKVKKGEITLTHFSDILRMNILKYQGGLWLDATIYLQGLPNISTYKFYTVRHGLYSSWHVCKGLWSGFFMAAGKGNSFISFCNDIFLRYWQENDTLIAYLLIDAVMAVGYEDIIEFQNLINKVPSNNSTIFDLANMLNEVYQNQKINYEISKLSYKTSWLEEKNGKKTVYMKIKENS